MRLCYILFGILIILSVIDFTVAASVPVQLKPQVHVDVTVVHIPEDATTMLGRRAGKWDKVLYELFGDPEGSSVGLEDVAKPDESSAARPSSSSQPSGLAGGSTNDEKPLPIIFEEPSQVSRPHHAPLNPEPAPQSDAWWLTRLSNFLGQPGSYVVAKTGELSAARQWWSSKLLEPADGWTDVNQPLQSIPEEPSPVSSPDHIPPNPGSLTEPGYELMRADAPPGPSGPSGHGMVGVPPPPGSATPIESDHEIDAPPSSSVSLTNPDGQWMGADSSSGKRKRP